MSGVRWYATVSATVSFLLLLSAALQANVQAMVGHGSAFLWAALVALVAWLDRRLVSSGREVAAAVPPSAVGPSTSRPGSP